MTEKNSSSSPRTSTAQLRWVGGVSWRFACALARHVQKFGLVYGFLLGSAATLCVLAALIWYVVLDFPPPWKITDPSDPRFDVTKFEFDDYTSDIALSKALRILFPIGTDKSDVDRVLGDMGRAKISKVTGKNPYRDDPSEQEYYCEYRSLRSFISDYFSGMPEGEFTWKVLVTYDQNNKLKKIHVI
jgi:hypothetical protein